MTDSTYANNVVAKATPPITRNSPNTALVTTARRVRQGLESRGVKLRWTHVKGHARKLTNGTRWSAGNDAADDLATKGKDAVANIGRNIGRTQDLAGHHD